MSELVRPIVVGYDGSAASRQALSWAVTEAGRRGLPLRLVYAVGYVSPNGPPMPTGVILGLPELRVAAEGVVHEAERQVRVTAPGQEFSSRMCIDLGPAAALLQEAERSELVVVGSRGRGGFGALLLGSTSFSVAMHATCPVVVVRGEERAPGGDHRAYSNGVIVGVDGSELSRLALAFAFQAASERQVGLTAVYAWLPPWMPAGDGLPPNAMDWVRAEQQAGDVLAETLAPWADKFPEVAVTRKVLAARPAPALVEHSRDADLLVVGCRGLGGFRGLLLGSVSQALIHHAHCPVVLV